MNRTRFVIVMGILLASVMSAPPIGGMAKADSGYDAVVIATGDDTADCERPDLQGVLVTQDVCNVQAAVNANPGGIILLKGTFHFAEYGDNGYIVPGTDGTVFITNDIEIRGEKQGNNYLTKIKGGYYTFPVGYNPVAWSFDISDEIFSLPENAIQVSATIQDIEFLNALFGPIRVWATTGLLVKGNKIIDGRSLSIEDFFGPGSHASGGGIVAGPPGMFLSENPQLVSGEIHIKDNYIDGMYRRAEADDPWAVPSYGVPIRGLSQGAVWASHYAADITIMNNQVFNTGFVGITSGGNDGVTKLKNNLVNIVSTDFEILSEGISGIAAYGMYFYDAYETAKFVITENEVIVGGVPYTWAITVDTAKNTPIVKDNEVRLKLESEVGIFLWDVSNASVSENVIEGEGLYGLALGHWYSPLWLGNDGNTVKENKLNSFNASVADYYLGEGVTDNSLYVRKHNTILNESGNDTNIIYR